MNINRMYRIPYYVYLNYFSVVIFLFVIENDCSHAIRARVGGVFMGERPHVAQYINY